MEEQPAISLPPAAALCAFVCACVRVRVCVCVRETEEGSLQYVGYIHQWLASAVNLHYLLLFIPVSCSAARRRGRFSVVRGARAPLVRSRLRFSARSSRSLRSAAGGVFCSGGIGISFRTYWLVRRCSYLSHSASPKATGWCAAAPCRTPLLKRLNGFGNPFL